MMSRLSSLVLGIGFAACAAAPRAQPATDLVGPRVRSVELPGEVGPGEPREARKIVDEPVLEVATIVLRKGTVLPEHHAGVPVTILALRGTGTITVDGTPLPLDATHLVVLAAGVPHSVTPAADGDLVLLVHHLGGKHEGEH